MTARGGTGREAPPSAPEPGPARPRQRSRAARGTSPSTGPQRRGGGATRRRAPPPGQAQARSSAARQRRARAQAAPRRPHRRRSPAGRPMPRRGLAPARRTSATAKARIQHGATSATGFQEAPTSAGRGRARAARGRPEGSGCRPCRLPRSWSGQTARCCCGGCSRWSERGPVTAVRSPCGIEGRCRLLRQPPDPGSESWQRQQERQPQRHAPLIAGSSQQLRRRGDRGTWPGSSWSGDVPLQENAAGAAAHWAAGPMVQLLRCARAGASGRTLHPRRRRTPPGRRRSWPGSHGRYHSGLPSRCRQQGHRRARARDGTARAACAMRRGR